MFPWTELPLENAITWTPRANWIKASLPGCRALIHLHWISLIPIIYLQLKIALNFVWSLCENQFRHATVLSSHSLKPPAFKEWPSGYHFFSIFIVMVYMGRKLTKSSKMSRFWMIGLFFLSSGTLLSYPLEFIRLREMV